jgi:hypothetical protein
LGFSNGVDFETFKELPDTLAENAIAEDSGEEHKTEAAPAVNKPRRQCYPRGTVSPIPISLEPPKTS